MLPEFVIGVDLGQVSDPTAICVVERTEQPTGRQEIIQNVAAWFDGFRGQPQYVSQQQMASHYQVIHLERIALGTSYVELPGRLHALQDQVRRRWADAAFEVTGYGVDHRQAPVEIVIDETGAGRPVFNLFVEAGLDPLGLTITAGNTVSRINEREVHVAKRLLVSTTQALMQAKRVKAAESLPDWTVLRAELSNFKAKISLSGSVSFEAGTDDEWRRPGTNDDLTLALAIALWAGEYGPRPPTLDPLIVAACTDIPGRW